MQYEEIKELSDEICEMYKTLQDNDADTAFYLMKESSLLLPSFEELSHEITKKAMNLERFAKASHAKISRDSSTKVTEGTVLLHHTKLCRVLGKNMHKHYTPND